MTTAPDPVNADVAETPPAPPDFAPEYYQARDLLEQVWRATAPADYRVSRTDIWRFFEDNARACARSSGGLPAFYDRLKERMVASSVSDPALPALLALPAAEARRVLAVLRHETSVAVLLLRVDQEGRRQDRKQGEKASPPRAAANEHETGE